MIDIRSLPTFYINCSAAVAKNMHMIDELTKNGFINFKRFDGIECRDGRAGCFLSHARCAFDAYRNETSEYVLILEDDVLFNDIDRINQAIDKSIKEMGGFDVFTITTPEPEHHMYKPPRPRTWMTHFLLYRRTEIPAVINRFYYKWLVRSVLDAWGPDDTDTIAFASNACIQDRNTYDSSINHMGETFIVFVKEFIGNNARTIVQSITGKTIAYSDIATYVACRITDTSFSLMVNDESINTFKLPEDRSKLLISIIRALNLIKPNTGSIIIWDSRNARWR